jgi:hypothetical protein
MLVWNKHKGAGKMSLYKTMYYKLFNAITDALKALEQDNTETVREVLITAQQTAEELYIGVGADE